MRVLMRLPTGRSIAPSSIIGTTSSDASSGDVAQSGRAPALQAERRGFDSHRLHSSADLREAIGFQTRSSGARHLGSVLSAPSSSGQSACLIRRRCEVRDLGGRQQRTSSSVARASVLHTERRGFDSLLVHAKTLPCSTMAVQRPVKAMVGSSSLPAAAKGP